MPRYNPCLQNSEIEDLIMLQWIWLVLSAEFLQINQSELVFLSINNLDIDTEGYSLF